VQLAPAGRLAAQYTAMAEKAAEKRFTDLVEELLTAERECTQLGDNDNAGGRYQSVSASASSTE
jgi:hypothetical protein